MSIKTFLIFAQVLLIQSTFSQRIGTFGYDGFGFGGLGYDGFGFGGLGYDGFGYSGLGYGRLGYEGLGCPAPAAYNIGAASLAASNGPGLAVSSVSPLIPAGVSVLSENAYEGALAVEGALPFLGTVALEGALPTVGAGSISYGCGDGAVAITAEEGYEYGLPGPLGIGAGYAGIAEPLGYGYGLPGRIGYGPGLRARNYGAFF